MTNEHTSLEKYTSHTLFSKGLQKGWCWSCVRSELETGTDCYILTSSSSDHSYTTFSFCWAARPRVTEGRKPSVFKLILALASSPQLELQLKLQLQLELNSNWLPASNWLTQTVCGTWLYNCLTPTCFLWASHLHRIQPRPQVKVISRYLRPDAPVSWLTARLKVNMLHSYYTEV